MGRIGSGIAVLLALGPAPATGQQWPAKPVRLIAPFPPGSGADVTGRIYAPRLTELLGRQFVVDSRAGAAGTIGAAIAAKSPADGYTMLIAVTSIASAQSIIKGLPFDLARDFDPCGFFGTAPYVLVVHPSMPARNVRDLVALAKARPGRLTYASTGTGGGLHLTMEMLRLQAGIQMLHVPYKGTSTAAPDLIGGQVDLMFGSAPSLMPHVRTGRLRALGVTSLQRSAVVPEVPTIAETLPGFEALSWFTVVAPLGTPRDVLAQMNDALNRLGRTKEITDLLAAQGTEPRVATPEQTGDFVRTEIAKWAKIVAAAGVRGE